MFYVYVLKSKKDEKHYIGFSTDLKSRYKEHCDGKVRATFYRRPLILVYYEAYSNRKIAQKRERQLKSGKAHIALIKRLK
ncbi:MAG: hypothetical protein A2812_01745 [Candidatus Staskawiczbacteria bacterium RIFCSPHIGHO2_01_FULL_36_16]|uniref:GIY-YIG domain-containing protein n=1 Tax=Candidatus Staskawiczbacteria bacterium RIFCSPHIGHO2_01_FULL_36_16 TaxID=1802200 RepID=A0A1G2HJR1_9BACT|nr:MAG: hypothetical protein A2812_01745 [Candidatus Staskawiczbacteria bacterium RIFCSPHIGHO2_01_FULL_36_16]